MVIVQKEGITWNFLNVLGVGILFYFVFYALNRWVTPLGISPTGTATTSTGTTKQKPVECQKTQVWTNPATGQVIAGGQNTGFTTNGLWNPRVCNPL